MCETSIELCLQIMQTERKYQIYPKRRISRERETFAIQCVCRTAITINTKRDTKALREKMS